jgi:hypothetical protein
MSDYRELKLVPDWPRIKQLAARRMNCSENEVQGIVDSGDSLNRVELVMIVEEVLENLHC